MDISTLDEPTLGTSLSSLFPNIFTLSRPITTPDVPVIVAASILSIYDSPMLPIVKAGAAPTMEKEGVKLYQAIGSQPIIRVLTGASPTEYYKVLWNSCTTTSIWIGSLSFGDTLDRLLQIFELTGFGDARMDGPSNTPALITLNEVVGLYGEGKLKCGTPVKDVASRAIAIDQDAQLIDAMKTMLEMKVRRLFLNGKKGEFISDRAILAYLFSPKGLKIARDSPNFWTDLTVSVIDPMKAHVVSPDAMVEDVGSIVERGRDVFMLPDGLSLLSRWDLVMKPWKARQLRISL